MEQAGYHSRRIRSKPPYKDKEYVHKVTVEREGEDPHGEDVASGVLGASQLAEEVGVELEAGKDVPQCRGEHDSGSAPLKAGFVILDVLEGLDKRHDESVL